MNIQTFEFVITQFFRPVRPSFRLGLAPKNNVGDVKNHPSRNDECSRFRNTIKNAVDL